MGDIQFMIVPFRKERNMEYWAFAPRWKRKLIVVVQMVQQTIKVRVGHASSL